MTQMSLLSLLHVFLALLAMFIGIALFAMRKGDRRHRVFGWAYVAFMLASLVAILIRGAEHPLPFHAYAVITAAGVVAALLASRLRARMPSWRAWHAALMSFSMLAAIVAVGGVIGGVLLGVATGPAYYRMFNIVIAGLTLGGLWIINTRPVIWRDRSAAMLRVRSRFTAFVVMVSAGLVVSQWAMF